MSHPFEEQLSRLREALLLMSSLTDRSMELAVRALIERDNVLAEQVERQDAEIDELEIEVDERVVTFMATQGPMARDSRMMLTACKISSNLERIADQATTIARRARELSTVPALISLEEIAAMSSIGQKMLRDAITAFVEGQYELAQNIIPRDKEVDEINKRVSARVLDLMKESPDNVERGVALLTISKAIERAADHAQNIAEEVFYLYRGRDIRHGHFETD